MKRTLGLLVGVIAVTAVVLAAGPSFSSHYVAKGFDPSKLTQEQQEILSGFAASELSPSSSGSQQPSNFNPKGSGDCAGNISSNIKANQNCLNISDGSLQGRGQAENETSIAIDSNSTNNVVASQNDYRRGDGNCYSEWSTDGGRTWNDSTDPMSFTRGAGFGGAREYWQAGGDTSVAFDTKGNAYLSCQVFNRGPGTTSPDVSSAFLLFRSQNHGASWNFPGRYVRVSPDPTNSGTAPFLDKQLMTVDNHVGSPFQDRIYVTWTEFNPFPDNSTFIYEAYSSDYGQTFSVPQLVSRNSPLCTNNYGAGTTATTGEVSNCNENQFSQPFTGTDGALYVVWDNYNNTPVGSDNRNQILLAKSTNGGVSFSAPVKVSDYYDLPDCATYQSGADFGRACVPEKGSTTHSIFRATNYPSGAVDPTNSSKVVVTFGSYINKHSKEPGCTPAGLDPGDGQNLFTGVKPGPCNNDILISISTNGGSTFTGTGTDPRDLAVVTQDAAQATTDQWWQWEAFTKNGKLAVSYYDRQYGNDETVGNSDFSLSGSSGLTTFGTSRVTSSSMPPPTEFSGTFFGDYTGLAAMNNAIPIWMDTRNPDLFYCTSGGAPSLCTGIEGPGFQAGLTANDQDIYVANMGVPGS